MARCSLTVRCTKVRNEKKINYGEFLVLLSEVLLREFLSFYFRNKKREFEMPKFGEKFRYLCLVFWREEKYHWQKDMSQQETCHLSLSYSSCNMPVDIESTDNDLRVGSRENSLDVATFTILYLGKRT